MYGHFENFLEEELKKIHKAGIFKDERVIISPQEAQIKVQDGKNVINFCANNYLGLSNYSELVNAAKEALDEWGYGLSSVRFICGTQKIHKDLEQNIAKFLEFDDAILYSSCFDANAGLFETLLGAEDAIISDELNHASIIDGVRLCKAKRYRYKHSDMKELEAKLQESQEQQVRLIATDGVFSMDGDIAKLEEICDLADKYQALVMVDDSHATGFLGKSGKGSHEYRGVLGRIDIMTSTLGKALGGASGGFTAAHQKIVDYLRQRSRPYLFSNTLAPPIVASALKAFHIISSSTKLRDKLEENTQYFRQNMRQAGFSIKEGTHPIVPIMLGDAQLANKMANTLLSEGIYVIGFSYPVVPKNQARIRVQISAAHEKIHLDKAIEAFTKVAKELEII